jgi:hypothetical protein
MLPAADAQFAEQPNYSLAESLPSIQELRHAAGVLRSTGFLGKFGSEWRTAKAVCRRTFPEERKLAPVDAAKRLQAAVRWKDRLQRLEECAEVKSAAGRHWKGIDTPFDRLISVAEWMRSIQKVTPATEEGGRELRRLAFEGAADEFATLADFAERAESLNLVNAFQAAYAAKSSIHAEARRQAERSAALQWIIQRAGQLGLQPNWPIEALSRARALIFEAKALRQKMAEQTVAVNACAAMTPASELERAQAIQATVHFVEKVLALPIKAPVARHLLQEGYATRLAGLKRIADGLNAPLEQVRKAAEEADGLLMLRPGEWCGGAFNVAPIRTLQEKCERAAATGEALDKQIILLSTELEASNLGLGDLIHCWPAEGLRYAGVAQAVEAVNSLAIMTP